MKIYFLILLLFFLSTLHAQNSSSDSTLELMGTRFELKAIAETQNKSHDALLAGIKEIQRIETLISSHQSTSITSEINRNSGIKPIKVTPEYFQLITRCKKLSQYTDGAFDISFGPIYKIYRFDGSMQKLPPEDSIRKYQQLIGFDNIELNSSQQTIFLKKRGMKIGFGAIGKGYAANRAKLIMLQNGAQSGFANASGDILFWGKNQDNEQWKVAIASPFNRNEVIGTLQVGSMAVVTSGNYEKNFTIDNKTYSHIIDPKTGYPVEETVSVTIFCPDAELSDGLATAVSVLGAENGLKLVNNLKGVECLIVDSKGNLHESVNLGINYTK